MKDTIITRARIFDSSEDRDYCIWAEETTSDRYMKDAKQAQALMNAHSDVVAHLMVLKIEDGEVTEQYGDGFECYAVNETKNLASEIEEAIKELGEDVFIGWYLTAGDEYLLMDEDNGTPIMVFDREEATEVTGIPMGDDTAGLNSVIFLADLPTF